MPIPEADQTPLLQQEDDVECRDEREAVGPETRTFELGQVMHNMKKLKSYDNLKSALAILTSDYKVVLSLILSIIPFFAFMVFFEIKLQNVAASAPSVLTSSHRSTSIIMFSHIRDVSVTTVLPNGSASHRIDRTTIFPNGSHRIDHYSADILPKETPRIDPYTTEISERVMFLYSVLQVCLLYLTVSSLLELLGMVTTIQIAAKVYAGKKLATLKEAFCRVNNLKGVLATCVYVQLLSFLSLLGLSWIVANHLFLTGPLSPVFYDLALEVIAQCVYVLSIAIHAAFFVALLYNYLYWSAFWNMSIVISVLEEEDAMAAFGLTHYYGKHCKPTGFQLMLGFVGFNVVLRLPCLYGGLYDLNTIAGITVTAGVIGLLCLGNLVKWVAFVLYYFDCKQHTMEKKNDEEIGKPSNNAERSV